MVTQDNHSKNIKKRRFLTIRITSREKAYLENKSNESDMDVSQYVREILFGGEKAIEIEQTIPHYYEEELLGDATHVS